MDLRGRRTPLVLESSDGSRDPPCIRGYGNRLYRAGAAACVNADRDDVPAFTPASAHRRSNRWMASLLAGRLGSRPHPLYRDGRAAMRQPNAADRLIRLTVYRVAA